MLGIQTTQEDGGAVQGGEEVEVRDEEEQVSIFYNYSADELVGNGEDTTEAFEPADVVAGYCGLDWSEEGDKEVDREVVREVDREVDTDKDDAEAEKVPDPDNLDPLNLMGEAVDPPPMPSQISPIRRSPNQKRPAEEILVSSSPLRESHILNTPLAGNNTLQKEEQQDEDMVAAALPLISILQKRQEEGEEAIRADLIQVSQTKQ